MNVIPFTPAGSTLDGDDCQAARRLIRWQAIELAERAGVTVNDVKRLEAGGPVVRHVSAAIRRAFECQGVRFGNTVTLDGTTYNTRTDEGQRTAIDLSDDCPSPDECTFRHPPLPREGWYPALD